MLLRLGRTAYGTLSHSQPVFATLNMRPLSSDAFAAKNYNIITVMALLQRRTYTSTIAINVFLKIHIQRFWEI